MDVDQSAVIARHKPRREDAHESGQRDKIGMESVDKVGKRGIETVAIRIVAVLDDGGRNAMRLRDLQPAGIRAIADHCRDVAWQTGFQQCLQVAAAAGNEDNDVFLCHIFGSTVHERHERHETEQNRFYLS